MTVKIIRTPTEGITDEMLRALYIYCQNYPGGPYSPKSMRQAMGAAQKDGAIERIIVERSPNEMIFEIKYPYLEISLSERPAKFFIRMPNIRPLALALLELDEQINGDKS